MVVGVIAGGLPALVKSIEGAEDDQRRHRRDGQSSHRPCRHRGRHRSQRVHHVRRAALGRQGPRSEDGLSDLRGAARAASGSCDVTIAVLTGPEVVTGSTRMKAGTATKLVLNTLTTGALIRLGKTYGNLMVDLQAKNQSWWTAASAS